MGLATIDPRSQKEHTEIQKIPKFGVNQASFDWDKRFNNVKINKEMADHTFLFKFWHFQMAVFCLLLGLFTPNLGIL